MSEANKTRGKIGKNLIYLILMIILFYNTFFHNKNCSFCYKRFLTTASTELTTFHFLIRPAHMGGGRLDRCVA